MNAVTYRCRKCTLVPSCAIVVMLLCAGCGERTQPGETGEKPSAETAPQKEPGAVSSGKRSEAVSLATVPHAHEAVGEDTVPGEHAHREGEQGVAHHQTGTGSDKEAAHRVQGDDAALRNAESVDSDEFIPVAEQLVTYRGRSMTVKERDALIEEEKAFAREQEARGLVRYFGEWIPEEERDRREAVRQGRLEEMEAFEKEQREKGLVRCYGEWVTREERDRILEEKRAAWHEEQQRIKEEQTAKGLVQYKGGWVSPEQKAQLEADEATFAEEQRAKGLILSRGRWITKEEKEELDKAKRRRIEEKLREIERGRPQESPL